MGDLIEQENLCQEHKTEIDKALKAQWILWIVIFGEVVVFIILCHVLSGRIRERIPVGQSFPLELIRIVFLVVGVLVLAMSYALKKYFLSPSFKFFKTELWKPNVHPRPPEFIIAYRQRSIFPMAIASIPGVMGFLLFVLGDSFGVFYIFTALSVLGLLFQCPRKEDVLKLYDSSLAELN